VFENHVVQSAQAIASKGIDVLITGSVGPNAFSNQFVQG